MVDVRRGTMFSDALLRPCTLRTRHDFLHAQQHGRRIKSKHMVMLVVTNSLAYARIGYTVSRKVGSAVVRNRVRRRLRECVRMQAHRLRPGLDIVLVAFADAAQAEFSVLREEVSWLLAHVGC